MSWFSLIGTLCAVFLIYKSYEIKFLSMRAMDDQMNGNYQKSIEEYKKANALHQQFYGRPYWQSLDNLGDLHRDEGDKDKALAEYTAAIKQGSRIIRIGSIYNPLSFTYCSRGDIYFDRKDFNRAIADYTEALRVDPTRGYALSRRALAYRAIGKLDLAAKDEAEYHRQGFK